MAAAAELARTGFDVRQAFFGNSDEAELAETAGYCLTG